MIDLFGPPWHSVVLDDVRRFLAGAEDEPLLWEAKGTRLDAHHVRKAVGGFANAQDGGYLVLGAEYDARAGWALSGVAFPDEPPLWVSSVVRDGLRPAPAVDVRAWPVGADRHVAVVRVPPLADPPCVARGTVFERVSGQTVPVKDPQRLADLYRRGRGAHDGAQRRADAAARAALRLAVPDTSGLRRATPGEVSGFSRVGVAVAPVDVPQPQTSDGLFSRDVGGRVLGWFEELVVHPSVPQRGVTHAHAEQDAIVYVGQDPSDLHAWHLRATWDGAVAVAHTALEAGAEPLGLTGEYVGTAYDLAVRVVDLLALQGEYYVAVAVQGDEWRYPAGADPLARFAPAVVSRGPWSGPVTRDRLDHIGAELRRIRGHDVRS